LDSDWTLFGLLIGDLGVLKDILELEYRSWSSKRRLTSDLMSLIATLGLCVLVVVSSQVTQPTTIENLSLLSVTLMGACAAGAIYAIFFRVKAYLEYRNYIMASM
jgi:hypothetical protein